MLQALYASVSGIQAHQTRMDVIGNNIANVNTVAYKGSRVNFEDQLSQTLRSGTGPSTGMGGTDPSQVGNGVLVAGIGKVQTQGNLQSTGSQTDFAVQGSGYFMVSDGSRIFYTRDGSFDLDANGDMVSTSTGLKLVGYQADATGALAGGGSVLPASTLSVPLGALTTAQPTGKVAFQGNLSTGLHAYSTGVDLTGNLDSSATTGAVTSTTKVYDELGRSYDVTVSLSNPSSTPDALGTAAGATRQWDASVTYTSGGQTVTLPSQKLSLVNGAWTFLGGTASAPQVLGASLKLDGGSGTINGARVGGDKPFALAVNFGQLGNAVSSSSVTGAADGSATVPAWKTQTTVYDSLGSAHDVTVSYRHVTLQDATATPAPPAGATARWEWQATVNGEVVADSNSTGNSPLYFGSDGKILGGAAQSLTIPSANGSVSPLVMKLDNSRLTQLANTSDLKVASQDGYPVGTLQSFSVSSDGVITGTFSSGQTRSLGQVALATFANPGGLEAMGSNLLSEGVNSGTAQVGTPTKSGRGKISSGYLETSNVDISSELTSMIVTQRGFQANTRVVTVVDALLQEVLNMSR